MTKKEAQETLDIIGQQLSEVRFNLQQALEHARQQLADFEDVAEDYDYQALRDMGFLSRRQLEEINAALDVVEG